LWRVHACLCTIALVPVKGTQNSAEAVAMDLNLFPQSIHLSIHPLIQSRSLNHNQRP
jgi:hypothetical protein